MTLAPGAVAAGLRHRRGAVARLGLGLVPDSGMREAVRFVPKANTPAGQCGAWRIERKWLRTVRLYEGWVRIGPGWVTNLMHDAGTRKGGWMSDSIRERINLLPLVYHIRGRRPHRGLDVLLNGLGLGLAVRAVLRLPGIMRVTVVELSPEVIQLVAPYACQDARVRVVQADAYTWTAPRGFLPDVVWHDIWPNSRDAIAAAPRLLDRWRGRCGWQWFWC